MENWINDAEFQCNTCDNIFKVYTIDGMSDTEFCPCCGSSQIKEYNKNEE